MYFTCAQHGFSIRSGEIVYLDMGGMVRTPVDIWPLEQTAKLVERAYNALLADRLPDKISDPDSPWECEYCPVRRICEDQEASLTKAT